MCFERGVREVVPCTPPQYGNGRGRYVNLCSRAVSIFLRSQPAGGAYPPPAGGAYPPPAGGAYPPGAGTGFPVPGGAGYPPGGPGYPPSGAPPTTFPPGTGGFPPYGGGVYCVLAPCLHSHSPSITHPTFYPSPPSLTPPSTLPLHH